MLRLLLAGYHAVESWLDLLRSPALLVFRVWVFWQLFEAGTGKLQNIGTPIAFFTKLHIPFPVANAWLVACVETFGSALIIVGLFARLAAIPVTISMIVAYVAADFAAWSSFLTDPDKFEGAAPFLFLLGGLAILIFGPGKISLDYLLSLFGKRGAKPEQR
jgi:putative oxidoreductase